MLTIPRANATKRKVMAFFQEYDIHKWTAGREKGKSGYEHWQIRFESSQFNYGKEYDPDGFALIKDWFPEAHIEANASDDYEYEKKEGRYFDCEDNNEKIMQRYGPLRDSQRRFIDALEQSGDREIVCWVDQEGSAGKSWLCGALYERRLGFYTPPFMDSAKEIVEFVCSGFRGERYVILDLPRDLKWTTKIYTAIEAIKDGLLADRRYHASTRNIRGVKVGCLTNSRPSLDRLSRGRWVIYEPS